MLKIKQLVAAAVVVLFAAIFVAIDSRPGNAAAADRDVVVVNTASNPVPTAAQGTTQVAGNVGASQVGTWTVGITNTENPARQPFHARGTFSMGSGEPDQSTTVNVPAGKRFVFEHVSAFLGVPDGQKVLFSVGGRVNGALQFHSLVAQEQGVFPAVLGLGAKATFVASESLRFYADPGTQVSMTVARTSTDGTAAGEMDISGHLVDIP
jgi:hypothetical protein